MKAGWHVLALDRFGHCSGLKPALLPSPPMPFQTGSGIKPHARRIRLPFPGRFAGMDAQSRLQAGTPDVGQFGGGARCGRSFGAQM